MGSSRPVEVRKHLEEMGHDVEATRKKYAMLSAFSHMGGTGETLVMEDIGDNVAFTIGGYLDPRLQRSIVLVVIRRVENLSPTALGYAPRMSRGITARLSSGLLRVCVPKTLSGLMTWWNRLSWRNDRAALFLSGRLGLTI
jgi:hypothetical protein